MSEIHFSAPRIGVTESADKKKTSTCENLEKSINGVDTADREVEKVNAKIKELKRQAQELERTKKLKKALEQQKIEQQRIEKQRIEKTLIKPLKA